jgi:Protein of unknown function (DUF2591)
MKHKVAELEGSLLDAAVAKAEGNWSADSISAIIERERITVEPVVIWTDDNEAVFNDAWEAHTPRHCYGQGPTPLIAAMRAYVASKFGDEVELP